MDNINSCANDLGDGSSDGEEDFESADEGEGKEKVSNACERNVSRTDSVPRNSDETGDVSKNLEPNSNKSVCDETRNSDSTENISEPSPGPSIDSDIGTNGDKDNISKVHDTGEETIGTLSDSPDIVEKSGNTGNEE